MSPSNPCPGADALARLADASAAPAERATLTAHVERCPLCRGIVGGLSRAQGREPSVAAPTAPPRATGDASAAYAPRNLWWVAWVTHAVLALGVGLAAWWFFGRTGP